MKGHMPSPMGKMGFDRSIVVFSPEGRMYQVEYARKAVENLSTTAVGVKFDKGTILVAARQTSKLMVNRGHEKISKIDEHIGIASCGILSDCRVLTDYARVRAQINRLTYDELIEINALVKEIADRKQRFTQMGGIRPYGVAFLIAGGDGNPRLFETDPSGTIREWESQAIGRGAKESRAVLEKNYKKGMNKDNAIELGVKALKAGEKNLTKEAIEIGIIEDNQFSFLDQSEAAKYL